MRWEIRELFIKSQAGLMAALTRVRTGAMEVVEQIDMSSSRTDLIRSRATFKQTAWGVRGSIV